MLVHRVMPINACVNWVHLFVAKFGAEDDSSPGPSTRISGHRFAVALLYILLWGPSIPHTLSS